jgi:hypothetical protein
MLEGSEEEQEKIKKAHEAGEEIPDERRCIKIMSWVTFTVCTIIGIWGLVFVIIELGDAHDDEV